jgi:hypothetical protein
MTPAKDKARELFAVALADLSDDPSPINVVRYLRASRELDAHVEDGGRKRRARTRVQRAAA